jgi:hypothetical protein
VKAIPPAIEVVLRRIPERRFCRKARSSDNYSPGLEQFEAAMKPYYTVWLLNVTVCIFLGLNSDFDDRSAPIASKFYASDHIAVDSAIGYRDTITGFMD